jgi:hypothetical protein
VAVEAEQVLKVAGGWGLHHLETAGSGHSAGRWGLSTGSLGARAIAPKARIAADVVKTSTFFRISTSTKENTPKGFDHLTSPKQY